MSLLDKYRVADNNWIVLPRGTTELNPSIKTILRTYDCKKIICQRLSPQKIEAARPNSLSSRHGLGRFPFHTDYATSHVPPNYIALVAPRPRHANTLLLDTGKLVQYFGYEHLQRCIFIQSGKSPRYCRIFTRNQGKICFQYNPDIMSPYNNQAKEVEQLISSGTLSYSSIDWKKNRIALINNWQALHAREACADTDNIGLFRFAIWGNIHDLEH